MSTSWHRSAFCHDDVIKWKHFPRNWPLCGEFTGPGEFPTQRPVTRSFDVFFDLRLNKRLSKQTWGWWFETLSWSLWRHCNVLLALYAWNPPANDRFSHTKGLWCGGYLEGFLCCDFFNPDKSLKKPSRVYGDTHDKKFWSQIFNDKISGVLCDICLAWSLYSLSVSMSKWQKYLQMSLIGGYLNSVKSEKQKSNFDCQAARDSKEERY